MSILSVIFGSKKTSPSMERLDKAFQKHNEAQTATRASISQLQKAVADNQVAKAGETKAIGKYTGHVCGLCKWFKKDECGIGLCHNPEVDLPMAEDDTCHRWEASLRKMAERK